MSYYIHGGIDMALVSPKVERQVIEKSQLTKLYEVMKATMDSKFYGSVEIKFEAGKVTIIRKTESLKI